MKKAKIVTNDGVLNLLREHFIVKEKPLFDGSQKMWWAVRSKIDGGYVGDLDDAH